MGEPITAGGDRRERSRLSAAQGGLKGRNDQEVRVLPLLHELLGRTIRRQDAELAARLTMTAVRTGASG
jgi:hypothetical protein